ncbi:hypothetical protein QTQ03_02065 [Micromonospora sp. WMMA1363]|uniref:hypothetical protein n=1 Tax=Micromonospora sp. WMMA1363 TaxID=3053985 RepID=UPI00259CE339|nr:hypothetical protein [Micromonospora sp. WMMA1363]MDM4718434.1 hypothetical protein [Micromonospora sp. WMMA1363]
MDVEYVVTIEGETLSGKPANPVRLDAVGGRLAVHEPRLSAVQDGPGVTATVTVWTSGPVDALGMANAIVFGALS